uniref:Dicer dsRNA-binding fold domain-containing protein n=1 Tax=Moniliophthora roreri TaxID=221103 RepID=A0A0W0FEI6_MONRR
MIYNVSRPQTFPEEAMYEDADSDVNEEVELDMQDRERYVVPHTSVFVNYDNSIALLNHLWPARPLHRSPRSGMHGRLSSHVGSSGQSTLHPNGLSYEGPLKHSKNEAKRAVTFKAVKSLRELDVFDEYLLPVASENGKAAEDVVRCLWGLGDRDRLWMHPVYMNGVLIVGLVTGTLLSVVQFDSGSSTFEMGSGSPLAFDEEEEGVRRKMLEEYTRLGIWHLVTTITLAAAPSLYLALVTDALEPDYEKQIMDVRWWSTATNAGGPESSAMENYYEKRSHIRRSRHTLQHHHISDSSFPVMVRLFQLTTPTFLHHPAILDLVVIHYLYRKFPSVTSHQLALPRTKAVCSPALSSVAIGRHLAPPDPQHYAD